MKHYLLALLLTISYLNINAQIKSNQAPLEEKIIVKNDTLKTNLTKQNIITYIQSLSKSSKPFRNEFITKVEANMEFDKMYMERRYVDQKFIIIPMKNVYFSQHAINQKNAPIQYIVVVEKDNDKGKIWRLDFMLVFPKDKRISVLPKNAFLDFASENITQIDGIYTYIGFSDIKQMELTVENGKRKQLRAWNSKSTGTDKCKDWTLQTSITNDDGTITDKKEYLGKTCNGCPPGFKCDPI